MIKLIVSDIDGTLTNHNSVISDENIEAIRFANKKGVKFAIASGRAYEDITPIFKAYPDIEFEVIAANGAQYYDEKGNVLASCFLDVEICKEICKIYHQHHLQYMIYTTKGVFTGCQVEAVREAFVKRKIAINGGEFNDVYQNFYTHYLPFRSMQTIVLEEFLKEDIEVLKIEGIDESEELINIVRPDVARVKGIAYLSSFPNNIEVTNEKAQKGVLLLKVIEKLKIKNEEVMVIGDGANDLTLFTNFECSVAVDNAVDCIKALAKHHVASNEENGVAQAIYKLIDKE